MQFPAIYFDGRSAKRHDVLVDITDRIVRIFDLSGTRLDTWPLKKIARTHPIIRSGPLRLRNRRNPTARLVIADEAAIERFFELLPRLRKTFYTTRRFANTALTLAVITSLVVTASYLAIPRLAKPIAEAIPYELEERIGRTTMRSLAADWPVCEGEGIHAIERLVRRLQSGRVQDFGISIFVVDSPSSNAFALPGGMVIVTDSLIEFMKDGDELAGVLAHEIGHVNLHHPLEGMLSQLGVMLFLNMVSGSGSGDLVEIGGMIAATSYSRDYERQADEEGFAILIDVQIDATAYGRLLERFGEIEARLADQDILAIAELFRTHPYSLERAEIAMTLGRLDTIPAMTEADWALVSALCAKEENGAGDSSEDVNGRVDRERQSGRDDS